MKTTLFVVSALAASISLVTACGGGGGGSTAGIGGTGITASGPITGFGSVFVNGVEFETNTTSYSVDDSTSGVGEDDLRIGMIVTVTGTVNDDGLTGTADSIDFDHELEGPISGAITDNGTTKTFEVMGITVEVSDTSTEFDDNISFATISSGDFVEVSGLPDESGKLIATYIDASDDPYQDGDEVEAKGVVGNLDTGAGTFDLMISAGSILVNYTVGTDLSDLQGGALAEGQLVEVKGTLQAGGFAPIDATEIETEGFDDNEDDVNLKGIITNFVSTSNFVVSGQAVNASTALLEPTNLALGDGVLVEVEGPIVNGVLIADTVHQED